MQLDVKLKSVLVK